MEKKKDYRALTSLKGLFILIIAVHNTLTITPLFSSVPGTAFIRLFGGFLGNSMFFILSGFLFSLGYKHRIQEHSVSFPEFLLRRLKKLYPMYILSNGVALLIEIGHYGVSAINLNKIVLTALMIGGPYNNPTWFLFVLFACYILFYGICYFAKSSTHYMVYITAAVFVGYTLMDADLKILFLRSGYGTAYLNFFLGCILAEIYPVISEKQHRWLQPLLIILLPLLLLLLLSYGVEIIAGDVRIAFSFLICPMILYLALVKGPCSRILQWKGFVALGQISSSIFFWHMVLYFIFCDVYTAIARTDSIQEPQYILYFVLMIVCSAALTKSGKRKGSL